MLLLLVVVLTACKTDLNVVADVGEDGSGEVLVTVVLDQEAAGLLLDLDDEGLRLEDLFQAGWEIVPPEAAADGSVSTTAVKRFGTPEQFTEIMEELSGSAGLFSEFALTRDKAFARVDYGVTGTLAPSGLAVFSDPALDLVLGRSLTEIAGDYGAAATDVDLTMTVRLPGSIDDEASTGQVVLDASDDAVRTWRSNLSSTAPVQVKIASTSQKVAALVWRGIAIMAALLAVLVAFGHLLRVLRPERRRGRPKAKPRPRAVDAKGPAGDSSVADEETDYEVPDDPSVLALDGMGVLYREGDDINRILVPFVRERGSEVTHDEIVAKARLISLGRITPSEFWKAVGVTGDPNEIDEEYLSRFLLTPGVVKFLRSMRDRGVRVACITNDSTAWATKLRARHSLAGLIDPWVVSGAVGVRKPDQPIYEVLRRVTGEAPAAIMVVDDSIENLDAARQLGFRTAWFSPDGTTEEAAGHAILRSFVVPEAVD